MERDTCLVEARYSMHQDAKDKLNALILEKTKGVIVSEEDVEEALDSLLFETSCRFVMRDVSGHRRRNDVWYSDPFYTGPQGYKMRLEVYANGVDEVRGDYCSVFIQLLEGEFDSRLTWPCRGRANVILLDQSAGRPSNIRRTIDFTFAQPVGGLPVAAAGPFSNRLQFVPQTATGLPWPGLGLTSYPTSSFQPPATFVTSARPPPPTAHSLSTRSGLPPKALKVGGQRHRQNRSPRHNFSRAYSAGLAKFVGLGGTYSPYETNNCSWYEVSVVHIT